MCIRIYQNINITKKTCIKIVPTNCFACEAQQLKKVILFTLKEIK